MNADGTGLHSIISGGTTLVDASCQCYAPADYSLATWSPDGTRLAFSTDKDRNRYGYDIATIAPDGTGLQWLTDSHDALLPDWSPDGGKLIFNRFECSGCPDWTVWTIGSDGLNEQGLSGQQSDLDPHFSPDGSKIVFWSSVDIWVMNADGTQRLRLTDVPRLPTMNSGTPRWSVALDGDPPEVHCAPADAAWHGTNVVVSCTAIDAGTGLQNPSDGSFTLVTDVADDTESTSAFTDSRTVCDTAQNCTTAGPIGPFKIDRKAPFVSCGSADGSWHTSNVIVSCSASEGGSGLANNSDSSFSLVTSVPPGGESDSAFTGTRDVCDAVNNCAPGGHVGPFRIDRSAPSIALTTTSVDATSGSGSAVSAFGASASDGPYDPSPPVSCLPATVAIGDQSISCSATDQAGNTTTNTFAVHVRGASEQVQNLITYINGAQPPINRAYAKSLTDKLSALIKHLGQGKKKDACSDLAAFTKTVNDELRKKNPRLTLAQGTYLLANASHIQAVVGC